MMNSQLRYVADADGTVVAVQVELDAWIALLEKLANYEEQLRPTSKLDKQLAELVRKRVGKKKKNVDLDDIGFIGTGRPLSEIESLLISAHIQAHKAKEDVLLSNLSKRKPKATARVRR